MTRGDRVIVRVDDGLMHAWFVKWAGKKMNGRRWAWVESADGVETGIWLVEACDMIGVDP